MGSAVRGCAPAAGAAPTAAAPAANPAAASPWTQSPTGLNVLASEAPAAGAPGNGLIGGAREWWGGLSGTEKLMAGNMATQGAGLVMQSIGANKTAQMEQDRYNYAKGIQAGQNIVPFTWQPRRYG